MSEVVYVLTHEYVGHGGDKLVAIYKHFRDAHESASYRAKELEKTELNLSSPNPYLYKERVNYENESTEVALVTADGYYGHAWYIEPTEVVE